VAKWWPNTLPDLVIFGGERERERERERESPISIVLQYLYSVRRPQGHHTFSWPLGIPMDVCDIYHYKLFLLGGGFFLKEKIQHYSSKNLAKQHRLK
jgi:hypothetical protein